MKKNIIITVFLMLSFLSSKAIIVISETAGGVNGYNKVNENHEGRVHYLDCMDPGFTACEWSVSPTVSTSKQTYSADEIKNYVKNLIISGTGSGSYLLDGEILVEWTGTDIYNYSITINDGE